jgi:hypothetical protein
MIFCSAAIYDFMVGVALLFVMMPVLYDTSDLTVAGNVMIVISPEPI